MSEPQFYLEDEDDYFNPTIWERAIPGRDQVVANLRSGVGVHAEPAYEDLAFAVLARVLAPDEATKRRIAQACGDPGSFVTRNHVGSDRFVESLSRWMMRAVLAALAEDPAVSP